MSRVKSSSCLVVVMLFILASITPLIPAHARFAENPHVVDSWMRPSETLSVREEWSSLFSRVNQDNIENIILSLSFNYPDRRWLADSNEPTEPLVEAWEYAETVLSDFTDGELSFQTVTLQENLIAVKNGYGPETAPIIIGGTIASLGNQGTNGFAASAAVVLECARLLHDIPLTNDVIFLLSNTIAGSPRGGTVGDAGLRALIAYLAQLRKEPAAVFWASALLYDSGEENGDHIGFRGEFPSLYVETNNLVAHLVQEAAEVGAETGVGTDVDVIQGADGLWERSGAFEASERGIPGFCFAQRYEDPILGTQYDVWNNASYNYEIPVEAVGLISSVVWQLGSMGGLFELVVEDSIVIPDMSWRNASLALSGKSPLIVNVTWDVNQTVTVRLRNDDGEILATESDDDGNLTLAYTITVPTWYELIFQNEGEESLDPLTYRYTYYHDFDRDGMNDFEEGEFGSDSLSADTDFDGLEDPMERELGTDPTDVDTDNDGIEDGLEVEYGTSPLLEDTDGDGFTDIYEIENGLDPTTSDSDGDSLLDGEEGDYGTDPLNPDSDGDGLFDGDEIGNGTDPLNPDSDGDGLSDLFEILNGLNPWSNDTDSDGLLDLYEVENNLLPFNNDTDGDGIIDSEDFAPKSHWMNTLPPFVVGTVAVVVVIWLAVKKRRYDRGA